MTTQTGDQLNIFERVRSLLPPWFGGETPNLDAFLQGGIGTALSESYTFYAYSILQTRIQSATGDFLDLIALDFFGTLIQRRSGENDPSFRNRILSTLLQQMVTRAGISRILTNLTGRAPVMIDGDNTDACQYLDYSSYLDTGFGLGGIWPFQGIILAFRPQPAGLYARTGLDITDNAGFGLDFLNGNALIDPSQEIIVVTDQDILETIELVKAFGVFIYVFIDTMYTSL